MSYYLLPAMAIAKREPTRPTMIGSGGRGSREVTVSKAGVLEAAVGLGMIAHGAKGSKAVRRGANAARHGGAAAATALAPTLTRVNGQLGMSPVTRRRALTAGIGGGLLINARARHNREQGRYGHPVGAFAGGAALGGGAVVLAHHQGRT